jgi:cell division septation protein DedD
MASTHDDGFREIQLSGKQLVFYCMAALVFIVVVFLMGVQVGRGVLAQRGLPGAADANAFSDETEPPPPPASISQGSSPPVTAGEKLSYAERLASPEPPPEQLKKAEEPVRAAPDASGPASGRASSAEPRRDPPASSGEPAGSGFEIQVGALRERGLADSIAKRLVAKGYPAYVVAPAKGTPDPYRVRVGKYKDRSEADTVAARLQKEEQFKPWVVR